jgi:hypothetical protein
LPVGVATSERSLYLWNDDIQIVITDDIYECQHDVLVALLVCTDLGDKERQYVDPPFGGDFTALHQEDSMNMNAMDRRRPFNVAATGMRRQAES